ncbi:MAG: shikimate dehydrogenase [Heliobacteriaceae bacterium]|nr:shikimate dehydrogenase [Heliobacteriaceae bacterium]
MAINGSTRWVGLLGCPVAHSFSPVMHNTAFTHLGLNWRYAAFAVPLAGLRRAVAGMAALGFTGANITVPHKEAVLPLLDQVDPVARRLGAVNTVVFGPDGKSRGFNTDGTGFIRGLAAAGFSVAGKRAVLLGAGGAARAVAFALVTHGIRKLTIVNRTPARAGGLLAAAARAAGSRPGQVELAGIAWEAGLLHACTKEADLVVNATPLGLTTENWAYPVSPAAWLHGGVFICDLVYNPVETELLAVGRQLGCRGQNGLPMLLYQGVAAFELWTGREAPVTVMGQALQDFAARC